MNSLGRRLPVRGARRHQGEDLELALAERLGAEAANRLVGRVATDSESAAWPCAAARTARSSPSRGAILEQVAGGAGLPMAGSAWLSVSSVVRTSTPGAPRRAWASSGRWRAVDAVHARHPQAPSG